MKEERKAAILGFSFLVGFVLIILAILNVIGRKVSEFVYTCLFEWFKNQHFTYSFLSKNAFRELGSFTDNLMYTFVFPLIPALVISIIILVSCLIISISCIDGVGETAGQKMGDDGNWSVWY